MPRRYAARQLTARDYALLRWVGRGGIAPEHQLLRRFWPGCRDDTARDRLRQIVKAGYVGRHLCDARRAGEVVYTLTAPGLLLFPLDERSRLQVGLPAAGEIRQQLVAQDVYLYLEETAQVQGGRLVDWQGERALRSTFLRAQDATPRQAQAPPRPEIPDAQVRIAGADHVTRTYDVEIDGRYHGQMLRTKLARFAAGGPPTLWICTSRARASHIRRAAAAYPNIDVLVVA